MATSKKKTTAKARVRFKDLKSKKNPKGGHGHVAGVKYLNTD